MLPSRSGTSGFALLLVALATTSCKSSEAAVPPPPPQPSEAEVTGILAAIPIGEQGTTGLFRIEVADAKVTLRNSANVVIANATTQLDGKFNIKAPVGTYDLCFDLQSIAPFCRRRVALNAPVSLGIVTARPRAGSIFGKVLTADGRACWLNDAFYKIDVATFLSVVRRRAVVQSGIRANIEGEYLIGGLSPGGYVVRADCEGARVSASLSLGSSLAGQNLTLPNRAPRIVAISASSGGQGISRPAAGSTIAVEAPARDPDGDPIEYLWRVLDGSGSIPGTNSSQQSWTMPPNAGYHSIYLLARDGKGGYDYQRLDIEVGAADVTFSGRVIDEVSQSPVGSATVKVGTVTTTTNSTGWFNMKVPAMASPERYVLNVQHSTYALLSRIHDKSAIGETYSLSRAQKTIHNPAGVIDVVDTNSSGPCGRRPKVTGSTAAGGLSTHGPVTTGPVGARRAEGGQEAYMVSVYSPSRNRVVRTRARPYKVDNKPCLHRGARVIVPAGALVDAAQNAPQGPVTLSFATMDPGRRALPGDYRAFDNNNAPVEMLSFGALYADFRDVNGTPLNLKTGTSAEIRVPVSAAQLAAAQPTIPIWSYDEKTGFWMQEGSANLTNTIEGWMYVGTTKHFSYLNMDVGGNDPAAATCVRLQIGQSLTNWQNLTLRAYVSYAGQFLQTKETALNGDQYHAIFRIPYAPPAVPPNTLRLEVRGVFQGTEVVLLDNIIFTDAPRPKMTGNNLWPPSPYAECGDAVVLEADPVNLPYYGGLDAAKRPAFLTGPYGDKFFPANGEQAATDYYATIDPSNTYATLSAWWSGHGFSAVDGSGGTNAAYLNFNDLGFGRDMNCKVNGADLACFVTNYGAPDQNPANADAAVAKDASKRGATVAMEYKASEPIETRVRFYVYGGGNPATAGKLKFADLDGLGPKPVPHLCTVCHGGAYDATSKNAKQSRFREFDLPSYKYSLGREWDYAPAPNTLNNAELTAFSALNKMVHDIAPATSPIREVIAAWYPGSTVGNPNLAPVKPAAPPGWSTAVAVYDNVYGKSCRTCHVARDEGFAVQPFLTFPTSASFQGTSFRVCGLPKVMPNAYVTYKNFWSDVQRVIEYRNFVGVSEANCH